MRHAILVEETGHTRACDFVRTRAVRTTSPLSQFGGNRNIFVTLNSSDGRNVKAMVERATFHHIEHYRRLACIRRLLEFSRCGSGQVKLLKTHWRVNRLLFVDGRSAFHSRSANRECVRLFPAAITFVRKSPPCHQPTGMQVANYITCCACVERLFGLQNFARSGVPTHRRGEARRHRVRDFIA